MPNCWRIDTFMSGKPDSVCAARVIAPPWPRQIRGAASSLSSPRNGEDREGERSDIAVHLAERPNAAKATAAAIHWVGRFGSAEARGLEVIIGLDDLPKRVFGTAVAAIGVGMMALYQHLEPSLDIGSFCVGFKAEHVEGAALGMENLAPPRRRPRMAGPAAGLAQHGERVGGFPLGGAKAAAGAPGRRALAADRAHFPGRTVAGDGLLLILRDRVVAHSGEKIVGIVVFAHVLEAEPPILAGLQPAFGRAMGRRRLAA